MQSRTVTQAFSVEHRYTVQFTSGAFSPQNPALGEAVRGAGVAQGPHRLLVLIEDAVAAATPGLTARIAAYAQAYAGTIELAGAPAIVAGGEACKNDPAAPFAILRLIAERHLDRHAYVAIVGGGALQDLAGFAVAIAHRGLRLIRFPTTVLGQADSGVGVKNGVNLFGQKNFMGTFAPPSAVINDSDFLASLGRRDTIAGLAEAVKVSLIRDQTLFGWMVRHARRLAACELEALWPVIQRSAELHLRHIGSAGDPFEHGSARPLDFGHWAAHKLETLSGHRLRHGEAVAIGVALDTRYSAEIGLLDPVAVESVVGLLEDLGLPLWDEALALEGADGRPRVLDGLREFREHLGGALTVTLLEGLGRGVEVHHIDEAAMCRSMDWLRCRGASPAQRESGLSAAS